jgi:hypothetical protein
MDTGAATTQNETFNMQSSASQRPDTGMSPETHIPNNSGRSQSTRESQSSSHVTPEDKPHATTHMQSATGEGGVPHQGEPSRDYNDRAGMPDKDGMWAKVNAGREALNESAFRDRCVVSYAHNPHTQTHIYVYVFLCVCVCVCVGQNACVA